MFSVYIIESGSSGKWYYGFSTNLELRLEAHNKGLNTSTANRGPWKFVFQRPFNSESEARAFELYLKKGRNKAYIKTKFPQYLLI